MRLRSTIPLIESCLNDQDVAAISGRKSMQVLKIYIHLCAEDFVKNPDLVFSGESDCQAVSSSTPTDSRYYCE